MANGTIYHIRERSVWEDSQAAGEYVAESLETQGFIHASTLAQLIDTANLLFCGQDGLVVLCIDEARLRAPVKRESALASPGHDGLFHPHLRAAEPGCCVRRVRFPVRVDGTFVLPPSSGTARPPVETRLRRRLT